MDFPMPLIATKLAATLIAFWTTVVGLYNYFQWQWVRNVEVDIWPFGKLTIQPSQNVDAYDFNSDEIYYDYDYTYSESISKNNDYQSGLSSLPMERCFVTIFIMSFAGSVVSLLVTSYNNARQWRPYSSELVRYGDIGFHALFAVILLIAAFFIILTPPPDPYHKPSIITENSPLDYFLEDLENVEEREDNRIWSTAFILTQSVLYGVILILLLRNSGPSSRSVSHFESGSLGTENFAPLIV